jgi:hypothetical protein
LWETSYEKLENFVVPRSSKWLGVQDNDGNQLWTVVLFRKNAEAFLAKARSQLKISVRTCEYNEAAFLEEKKARGKLTEEIRQDEAALQLECETVYSALFEYLIHMKVLRTHIECVLRWGIPPKYFLCALRVFFLHIHRCSPPPERRRRSSTTSSTSSPKHVPQLAHPPIAQERTMYGSKEELGETEDYYPFIIIPLGVTVPA